MFLFVEIIFVKGEKEELLILHKVEPVLKTALLAQNILS